MKSYALIHEYEVTDVVKTNKDINTLFTPEFATQYIPCTDVTKIGWIYDGTTFSPPHEPTPAEIEALQADAVRTEREKMLAVCDWTQMVDSPLDDTGIILWQSYRQALRDVPQQAGFPNEVVWPEAPAFE